MTVTVIDENANKPEGNETYETQCPTCKARLSYKTADVQHEAGSGDATDQSERQWINCPQCAHAVEL